MVMPPCSCRYSRPIEYGQDRDASERAVLRSRARAAELRKMLEPLLLQVRRVWWVACRCFGVFTS